jgi:hypothetical protein
MLRAASSLIVRVHMCCGHTNVSQSQQEQYVKMQPHNLGGIWCLGLVILEDS